MRKSPLRISATTALTSCLLCATAAAAPPEPSPAGRKVVTVGTRPESVTRGWGGRYFVTVMNEQNPGDGVVKVLEGDTAKEFAAGFDEPKGITFTGKYLVTTDVKRLWRIDQKGEKTLLADEADFPHPVSFLNDVVVEPGGAAVYVTDMGANKKMRDDKNNLWPLDSPEAKALPAIGRVYRVAVEGAEGKSNGKGKSELAAGARPGKVSIAVDASPDLPCPNGVFAPAKGRLLVAEFFKGNLLEARGKTVTVLASGYRGGDGIAQDRRGKGKNEELIADGFQSAADLYLDERAKKLLVPDMKAGTVTVVALGKGR
jgi:hypothetical protein